MEVIKEYFYKLISSIDTYEIKLALLNIFPFLLVVISLALFGLSFRANQYKDRNKGRKVYEEIELASEETKIKRISIKLTPYKIFEIIIGIVVAALIYLYLSKFARTVLLHIEIVVVAFLVPYAFYNIKSGKNEDRYNSYLPSFLQDFIDALRTKNNILVALRCTEETTTNEKLRTDVKKLGDMWEEMRVVEGLNKFYEDSGYNLYIYQLVTVLEFYHLRGGEIVKPVKRIKDYVSSRSAIRQKRKSALFLAKIVGALCVVAVPLSVEITKKAMLGFLSDYYYTSEGQNMIAFALMYSIIALLLMFVVEKKI